MSGYRQTYDQWRADPQAFWAEAAREISWIKAPERIFDAEAGVYGRWFPDARVNACYNAVDRHVEDGRGDQPAIYYDSPVTGTKRTITYAELLDETATLAAVLHDLGVVAGDRVLIYMPMIPEAMVGDARLRPHRRDPFGGVRRLRRQGARDPHRRRRAEGDPDRELRHRAGPHRRIQAPARPRDRPRQGQAQVGRGVPAPADRGAYQSGARPRLEGPGRRRARPPASGRPAPTSQRPIRSTSSTPRARPACRRGWCATSAATSSRSSGPCRRSTTSSPARPTGPPPTSAGWSAIPTSSTRRCCTAARPCSTKASRSARPTRARSGG